MYYKLNVIKNERISVFDLEKLIEKEILLPKSIAESENSFGEYLFINFQLNPKKLESGEVYFVTEKVNRNYDKDKRFFYVYEKVNPPSYYQLDAILVTAYGIGYNFRKEDYDMLDTVEIDINNQDIMNYLKQETLDMREAIRIIFTHRNNTRKEAKEYREKMSTKEQAKADLYDSLRTITCEDSLLDVDLDEFLENE